MRLHADFAERGTANSVHRMNAEGDVANCLWAAAEPRNLRGLGAHENKQSLPIGKFIHEKAICIATINPHRVGAIIVKVSRAG